MAEEELQQTTEEKEQKQKQYLETIENYINNYIIKKSDIELNDNNEKLLIEAIKNFDNVKEDIDPFTFSDLKETFIPNVEPEVNNDTVEFKATNGENFDVIDFTKANNNDSTLSENNKKVMKNIIAKTNPQINVDIANFSKFNNSIAKEAYELKIQQDKINELMKLKRGVFDKSKQEIYDKTNTIIEDTNNAINSGNFNREAQSNVLLTRIYGNELITNFNHIKPLKSILDELNQHPTRENAVKLRNAFFEKRDMKGQVVNPNDKTQQNIPYLDGSSYIQNVDDFDNKLSTLVQGNKFKKDTLEWQVEQQKLDSIRENVTNIINDRFESIEMKQKTVSFANENIETALKAHGIDSFPSFEVNCWDLDKQTNSWKQNKINILDGIIDLNEETISKKMDQINKKNLEYYQARPGAFVKGIYESLHSRNEVEAMKSKYGVFEYISMYKAGGMATEFGLICFGIGQSIWELIKSSNEKAKILSQVAELKKSLNTEDYLQKKNDLVAVDVTRDINIAFEEALKKDPSLTLEKFLVDENNKEILEKLGINKDEFLIIHNVVSKNIEHKDLFDDLILNNEQILKEYDLDNDDIELYLNLISNKDNIENLQKENPGSFELFEKVKGIQKEIKKDIVNFLNDKSLLNDKDASNSNSKYKTFEKELEKADLVLKEEGLTSDDLESYLRSQNILTKINQIKSVDSILKEVNEIENKNIEELNQELNDLNKCFQDLLSGEDKNSHQHEFLNIYIEKYKNVLKEFQKEIDEKNRSGFDAELDSIKIIQEHHKLSNQSTLSEKEEEKLTKYEDIIKGYNGLGKHYETNNLEKLYDIVEINKRESEIKELKNKYLLLSNNIKENVKSMEECNKLFTNGYLDTKSKMFLNEVTTNQKIKSEIDKEQSIANDFIVKLFENEKINLLNKILTDVVKIDKNTDINSIDEIDDQSKQLIIEKFMKCINDLKQDVESTFSESPEVKKYITDNNLTLEQKNNVIDAFTKSKLQEVLFDNSSNHVLTDILSKTLFFAEKLEDVLFELKPDKLSIDKENLQKIQDLKTLRLSIQKELNDDKNINNSESKIYLKDLLNIDIGKDSKITEYNKLLRDLIEDKDINIKLLPKDLRDDIMRITDTSNNTIKQLEAIEKMSIDKIKKDALKSKELNQKIDNREKDIIHNREIEKTQKMESFKKEKEDRAKLQMASQQNTKPQQENEQENIKGIGE